MKRVYLADSQVDERLAFRILLRNLKMQIVGEASDWPTALAHAPSTHPDMILVDWGMIAPGTNASLADMRKVCPAAVVMVLISHLDAREQAAISAGADAFISKSETADRVVEKLRDAAAG